MCKGYLRSCWSLRVILCTWWSLFRTRSFTCGEGGSTGQPHPFNRGRSQACWGPGSQPEGHLWTVRGCSSCICSHWPPRCRTGTWEASAS